MAQRKRYRPPPIRKPNLTPWWAIAGIILLTGATLLLVALAILT
jgi:hypothetical protein